MTSKNKEGYDGFHFLPNPESEDENEFIFHFFKLTPVEGSNLKTETIGGNEIGDMYNVLLMKEAENENVEIDDVFQAVFADPIVYAENLIKCEIYGTILRNSELNFRWWKDYVSTTKKIIEQTNNSGE
jgi:hypothetical protein